MLQKLISRSEVCAMLGICRDTARLWALSGKLKSYNITDNVTRYELAEVERVLRESLRSPRRKPGPKNKAQQALASAVH
jgi:predicted site-specific integrase-resolvase